MKNELKVMEGSLKGSVNGHPIDAIMNGKTDSDGKVMIDSAPIAKLPGKDLQWNAVNKTVQCAAYALEKGDALNIYSLTGGSFKRELYVSFPSGPELQTVSYINKLDENFLTVHQTYSGTVPSISPNANLELLDSTQLMEQENATSMIYHGTQHYLLNGEAVNVDVFVRILYDGKIQLPFKQIFKTRNIRVEYNEAMERLHYELEALVEPKTL